MVAGAAVHGWAQQGYSLEVKHTFLQLAFDEELSPLSRRPARKTCPEHMFVSDSEDESEHITVQVTTPYGLVEPPAKKELALAAAIPHWVGGAVTVKNTFISVALDSEEQDEELMMLQAARRRDAQSCPYLMVSNTNDDDGPPLMLSSSTNLSWPHEQLHGVVDGPLLTPTNDAMFSMQPSFGLSPPSGYAINPVDAGYRAPRDACVNSFVHWPAPIHKVGFVHHQVADNFSVPASPYAPASTLPSDNSMKDIAVESRESQHIGRALSTGPVYSTGQSSWLSETQALEQDVGALTSGRVPRRRGGRGGKGHNRLWCHVFLDPTMLEPGFDLVKKIIGRSGCNTRKIFEATQTKVRVRGRGSGHKEIHNGREAPVPLMLALAADHGSSGDFQSAFNMTKELLHDVSRRFESFQARQNKSESSHSARRFWVGEISEASKASLGDSMNGMM